MKNFNLSRAIAAGFIGTLLMTMIMMLSPAMGMPKMDIAAMLGTENRPSSVGYTSLVGAARLPLWAEPLRIDQSLPYTM